MSNLSQILADSDWGKESARINQNFQNINTDLEKVKSATTKFKGYFTTEESLKNKFGSPKEGDTAWVGETYPGTVYDVQVAGSWHNTGKAPDTGSVDLQDYAKKEELTELEYNSSKNIIYRKRTYSYLESGFLTETGEIQSSSIRKVTKFIELDKALFLSNAWAIRDANGTFACLYDKDKNFLTALKDTSPIDSHELFYKIIDKVDKAYYLRATVNSAVTLGYGIESFYQELNQLTNNAVVNCVVKEMYIEGNIPEKLYIATINREFVSGSEKIWRFGLNTDGGGTNDEYYFRATSYPGEYIEFTSNGLTIKAIINWYLLDSTENKFTIGNNNSALINLPYACSSLNSPMINLLNQNNISKGGLTFESGYYLSEIGENEEATSYPSRMVSNYIDIPYSTKEIVVHDAWAIRNSNGTFACLYDENKNFLVALKDNNPIDSHLVRKVVITNKYKRARYVRITSDTSSDIPNIVFINSVYPYWYSPNINSELAVFGGSFSVISPSKAAKRIWQNMLGVTINSFGVGGAGFVQGSNIQTQVDNAISKETKSTIFILWASTNDFVYNVPLGEPTDYTSQDSFDDSKLSNVSGGFNYCVKKILEYNPKAKIALFTSLRFFSQEYGYNPYSSQTNSLGKKFLDYIDAMKKCADRFNIPVLDLWQIAGINEYNYTTYYQSDKLHMNELGYERIAPLQVDFLANL